MMLICIKIRIFAKSKNMNCTGKNLFLEEIFQFSEIWPHSSRDRTEVS